MFGLPYKLVGEALAYAVTHHTGQFRKDEITPYIVHPIGVADIVYENGQFIDMIILAAMIIAALFHDILEDCEVTEEQMREKWGDDVTDLVIALTNTSKRDHPELNRAARKVLDAERLRDQQIEVHFIKLADILYNINDLDTFTDGFARKFLGEKRDQVIMMTSRWDETSIAPEYLTFRQKVLDRIDERIKEYENK